MEDGVISQKDYERKSYMEKNTGMFAEVDVIL